MLLHFDLQEVKKAINLLHPKEGELFEIRLIGKNPRYTASGIFSSAETAVKALCNYQAGYKKEAAAEAASIYITINPPVQDCYSLAQHDKFVEGALTVNDTDIDCLNWLFIDLDPERRTGISSSGKELKHAETKSHEVYDYLRSMDFPEPVIAMSGNGYHLMYRLDSLANNEENVKLIEATLKALSERFSDEGVKVDIINFNPSRICKLWGSLAQKGANTPERPHRMSCIEYAPDDRNDVETVPAELLFKVIEDCSARSESSDSKEQLSTTTNNTYEALSPADKSLVNLKAHSAKDGNKIFNLEDFFEKHSIGISATKVKGNGDIYYYLQGGCAFDSTHTGKDAAVIQRADGTLCYHCFHNSCNDKGWKDFRLLYEPNAYDEQKGKKSKTDDDEALLLTVDIFTEFCKEYGFSFKWDAIKNEMIYGGFDKGENPVTLPNTAPTILQGILKPLGYKGATIENICNCIQVVGTRNTFNAILDRIDGCEWDGVDRIAQIFEMWQISADDTLSRTLIKKWLKQCYCMLHNNIDNPFSGEFALVFMGGQGAAKTRFFEKLALINKYYGEGKSINPDNKDSTMQATTVWICELGEIGSTMKKDLDKVKAFMTLAVDEYRVPYGRTTERHPRITSFCGTVNDEQFLLDQTGNRRWGTIKLPERLKVSYDEQIKPFNAEQLWAQVKQLVSKDLQNGYTYANCFRLTQEEQVQLSELNNGFTKPMKGYVEIRDVIEDIMNNVPENYELGFKTISATEFKRENEDVLRAISANQIGQVLNKLGYEQTIVRENGRQKRGYNLPCHNRIDNGSQYTVGDGFRNGTNGCWAPPPSDDGIPF